MPYVLHIVLCLPVEMRGLEVMALRMVIRGMDQYWIHDDNIYPHPFFD
jgi:hypothetical protein